MKSRSLMCDGRRRCLTLGAWVATTLATSSVSAAPPAAAEPTTLDRVAWLRDAGPAEGPTEGTKDSTEAQMRRAGILSLEEVLDSVDRTHPKIAAAGFGVDAAEARRFSARGVWDPELRTDAKWNAIGYYRNGQVDAVVRQATPLWGLGAYAGYRLGSGDFATYKGELETLAAGELRAGLDLPLWKGGPIDEGRAEIARSKLELAAANCQQDTTRLMVHVDAAKAYWKWVEAGQEVRIQRDLLSVALERDRALRGQAEAGSIPVILLTDNERLVLDREAKLVAAERKFAEQSQDLSLYLRDAELRPIAPGEPRVPPIATGLGAPSLPSEESDISSAISRRPDLCELQREKEVAKVDLRLAKNNRAPDIRVRGFVAQDIGGGDPVELAPFEAGVGGSISMPLLLRAARGKVREAEAKLAMVDAKIRGQSDKIAAEVRRARIDLIAAHRQLGIAIRQVEVAETLARAEREKLKQGASDLVILNLRELAAADATRLEVEAVARYKQAQADYVVATGRALR